MLTQTFARPAFRWKTPVNLANLYHRHMIDSLSGLNLSDELVRRILDEMPAAVFCKDADDDFRMVFWNRHAERLWGMKAEDVIGKNDFELFLPEQAEFFRQKDLETMQSLGSVLIPEEELHVPAGKYWVRTRKVPLALGSPPRRFLLGISEDITEDRFLRHELEAQRATASSSREMAAIGELAGGIAHEINSPLGALVIQMEILGEQSQDPLKPVDPQQLLSAVEMLRKTSSRISEVTRTLSTYASYSRRMKPKQIRPQTILLDALAISRERLRLANVESEMDLLDEDVSVRVRPMEILQVVLKMLDLGLSALDSGEKRKISIALLKREDSVEIRIAGGTMLGEEALAVCETVIRSHSGQFSFEQLATETPVTYVISLPRA